MMETEKKFNAQKAKVEAKRQYLQGLRDEKMSLIETGKYEEGDTEVREAVWAILDKIDYAERSLRRLIKNAIKMAMSSLLSEEELDDYMGYISRKDIIELNKEYDTMVLHKFNFVNI